MKKIAKTKLQELWQRLSAEGALHLPVRSDRVVEFVRWQEDVSADLDALNAFLPPKKYFYPQTETVLKYQFEDTLQLTDVSSLAGEKTILFGVRPCDAAAFSLMDKVYLGEPVDEAYRRRRESTVVIALGCLEPEETCFCLAFDIDPGKAPGADLLAADTGTELVFIAQSSKGEELLAKLNGVLQEATSGDENKVKDAQERAREKYVTRVSVHGLAEKLDTFFDSVYWDRLYRRCIACGTCTYLCPTCHCFDLQEYAAGRSGERIRCWDACMFPDFTQMAGGHNPRPTQKERVRQRFMHKLNYFPRQHGGEYACVGCGRCVRQCPVHLDILEVIREMGGAVDGR
jgi:ferredoxin